MDIENTSIKVNRNVLKSWLGLSNRIFLQMIEMCSPIVSSTSHPELKSPLTPTMVHLRGSYPVRQHENNIGSIITMLIDDQVRCTSSVE